MLRWCTVVAASAACAACGGSTSTTGDDAGGVIPPPAPNGNPDGSCAAGVPASGLSADVSHPTTIVGSGTADSCTNTALAAAVARGGVITFACGADPVAIPITATLKPPLDKDTVIDGGNLVTLDGGGTTQILVFDSPNWQALDTRVTVQHLTFAHGFVAPSEPIPTAPAPCSQGFNAGEGGAIFMRDGNLTVIDCAFVDNHAAPLGPDVGGGAIRMLGSKHGILVVGSTFRGNAASNGGAIGNLFAQMEVYNSLVEANTGTGHDANNDDASKCSVINNGQHEIGSGGNGGALYSDGNSTATVPVNILLCGDKIVDNHAGTNAFGGGVFFTSNNFGGTLSIIDSTITGNTGGHWTNVQSGSVTDAGTAVGTNAKSITITNSTVQGVK